MTTAGDHGLFSDGSMIRRVHGEGVLLLGGGRALLMQLAHPKVAAGVAEHTEFPSKGAERLLRTLRLMLAIVFGSERQAMEAAGRINAVHERVTGHGYAATDADLLLWVHATLVDTSLLIYRRFVRPLSEAELRSYYADMKRLGGLLGIPDEIMPQDIHAFDAYVADATASLRVSPQGKALAADVLGNAPGGFATSWLMKQLTAELLPPRLREEFGLSNGAVGRRLVWLLAGGSRAVLPLVPPRLRRPPWFVMPPRERAG